MATKKVTTSSIDWRALVEQHEGKSSLEDTERQVVWYFGGGEIKKKGSGPDKGIYETP